MFWIITNPVKRFREIIDRPDWSKPFIVFLVITVLAAIIATVLYVMPNKESILAERDLTEEQMERALAYMSSPMAAVISGVSAAVITAIRILTFTFFFYLMLRLLEAKQTFKNILNITANCALIGIVAYAIKVPLTIVSRQQSSTALSLFLSHADKTSFLHRFLARIDFFAGWETVVLIIGLAMLSKMDKKRLFAIVVPCWLLYNALMATFQLRGGM